MLTPMPRRRSAAQPPGEFVTLSVRFPAAVHQALLKVADEERRSVSAQVLVIVERYLAERQASAAA
jgi:hypothetical protein